MGKEEALIKEFDKYEINDGEINKKNFVKCLKKAGLSQNAIEYSVGESAIFSQDIEHLNYYDFIKKTLHGEETN